MANLFTFLPEPSLPRQGKGGAAATHEVDEHQRWRARVTIPEAVRSEKLRMDCTGVGNLVITGTRQKEDGLDCGGFTVADGFGVDHLQRIGRVQGCSHRNSICTSLHAMAHGMAHGMRACDACGVRIPSRSL